MAARDHLQRKQYQTEDGWRGTGTQLPALIPAHELVDSGQYDSVDLGKRVKEGHWDDKFEENRYAAPGNPSFNTKIRKEGVQRPANIAYYNDGPASKYNSRGVIGNGHHRIAALYTNDRNTEVPVIHHDDDWAATAGGHQPYVEDDNEFHDRITHEEGIAAWKAKRANRT